MGGGGGGGMLYIFGSFLVVVEGGGGGRECTRLIAKFICYLAGPRSAIGRAPDS